MPGSSTLVATFPGGTLAALFPNSFGSVSEVGGRARVQANNTTNAMVSDTIYTFDGFYGRVYPDDTSGGFTYSLLGYYADENNRISIFYIDGDALYFEIYTANVQNATTLAFNPTNHAWWSIIPSGGNLLFRTSPDGTTWTTQRTVAAPGWVAATTAGYLKFELSTTTATGLAELDNLNTLGLTPPPSTAFPQGPLAIKAEMSIAGTWTNITHRVRGETGGDIEIERGYRNESGGNFTPSVARFTLNNRDGFFSTRAPASVNYGKLPPGTKVRFSVDDADGEAFAPNNDYDGAFEWFTTADKTALDITGDMEVRFDLRPEKWIYDYPKATQVIGGKYDSALNSRSWYVTLSAIGRIGFIWSANGTGVNSLISNASVPFANGSRGAIRILFDVDNGASGRTATFYTGPDILAGPWTQLGTAVTSAGVTSIFNSTAALTIGHVNASFSPSTDTGYRQQGFTGRIFRAQVYSGLTATTLRADPNFGGLATGTTSFSDGLGTPNTWTLSAGIGTVNDANYRFHGEVAELPQRWDTSGTDVYVPTQAADFMRRLTQGADPVQSPLYRYLSSRTDALAYWPLEEETGATRLGQVVPGAEAGRFRDVSFGADSTFPASASVITFNSANSYVTSYSVRRGAVPTTYSTFVCHFKFPSVPATNVQLVSIGNTRATVQRWSILVGPTAFTIRGHLADDSLVGSQTIPYGSFASPDRWTSIRFQSRLVSGYMIVEFAWIDIENRIIAGSTSTTEFPVSGLGSGIMTGFNFAANTALNGLKIAHVFMGQAELVMTSQFSQAATAYDGEAAGDRMQRVAGEEGVAFYLFGRAADTELLGPQPIGTFLATMEGAANVDGGFLVARRDAPALSYISQPYLRQRDSAPLSYALAHLSGRIEPTDDDQILRNDVTVTRVGGSFARAVKETGARSVADVGRYTTSYQLQAFDDDRLPALAGYAVFLGTWDELRYPVLEVNLARAPFVASSALSAATARLDVGTVARLTGLPSWLPPDDVELLVRGLTERLQNRGWLFKWNLQAYGPWRNTNMLNDGAGDYNQASARNAQLNASITSTATSFAVKTVSPAVALWRTGTVNLQLMIGGELMTVGSISGTSSPQTFSSVTRSQNGVVKAHAANAPVNLYKAFYAQK
jgi:hypothetical protein